MVWEQHCFCQIMDTNTKGKIAHLGCLSWAFFHLPKIFKWQALPCLTHHGRCSHTPLYISNMSKMECCVSVSTETVLQVVKFYTVVKKYF